MSNEILQSMSFNDANNVVRHHKEAIRGQQRQEAKERLEHIRAQIASDQRLPRLRRNFHIGGVMLGLIVSFIVMLMRDQNTKLEIVVILFLLILIGWMLGNSLAPALAEEKETKVSEVEAKKLKALLTKNKDRLPEEEEYIKDPVHQYIVSVFAVVEQYNDGTEAWRNYQEARALGLAEPSDSNDREEELGLITQFKQIRANLHIHRTRAEFLSLHLANLSYAHRMLSESNAQKELDVFFSAVFSLEEFALHSRAFVVCVANKLRMDPDDQMIEEASLNA